MLDLDEIEAQLDSTVPYYLPALVKELRSARAALRSASPPDSTSDVLRKLATWIRTPGNINAYDAIDECARLLENNARALSAPVDPAPETPSQNPLAEFCQSEGPRGETICVLPLGHDGPCGWERGEDIVAARARAVSETIDSLQDGGWLSAKDADHIRATLPAPAPPRETPAPQAIEQASPSVQSENTGETPPWRQQAFAGKPYSEQASSVPAPPVRSEPPKWLDEIPRAVKDDVVREFLAGRIATLEAEHRVQYAAAQVAARGVQSDAAQKRLNMTTDTLRVLRAEQAALGQREGR